MYNVLPDYNLTAPNLTFTPYEIVQGVRRFYLTAEIVHQQLVKGVTIKAWGYNGSTPGPVIVARQGERVQIVLHNKLPEATAIHWHGLVVPNSMDGVPGMGGSPLIKPGEYFVYDFMIRQAGTYMYHSHANAKQEMMGLSGLLISLPPATREGGSRLCYPPAGMECWKGYDGRNERNERWNDA